MRHARVESAAGLHFFQPTRFSPLATRSAALVPRRDASQTLETTPVRHTVPIGAWASEAPSDGVANRNQGCGQVPNTASRFLTLSDPFGSLFL